MEPIKIRYNSVTKCAEMMVRGGMIINTVPTGSAVVTFTERANMSVVLKAAPGGVAWANDFFNARSEWVSIPPDTIKGWMRRQASG